MQIDLTDTLLMGIKEELRIANLTPRQRQAAFDLDRALETAGTRLECLEGSSYNQYFRCPICNSYYTINKEKGRYNRSSRHPFTCPEDGYPIIPISFSEYPKETFTSYQIVNLLVGLKKLVKTLTPDIDTFTETAIKLEPDTEPDTETTTERTQL